MTAIYKQDLNEEYLVLEETGSDAEDYRFYMLLFNHIEGLLPCSIRSVDGRIKFHYLISGKLSLRTYLEKHKISYRMIQSLIAAILDLENRCKEYLLNMDDVILDPDYVFVEEPVFYFCYLPGYHEKTTEAVHALIGGVIEYADYKDERGTDLLYRLHSNTRGNYSLRTLVRQMTGDIAESASCSSERKSLADLAKKKTEYEEKEMNFNVLYGAEESESERGWIERIKNMFHRSKKTEEEKGEEIRPDLQEDLQYKEVFSRKEEFWEEELEGDPATTFLYINEMHRGIQLQSANGNENYTIAVFPYIIGSGEKDVDGFVGNPTVSRKHCRITEEKGIFFLWDLNSMNGTFVNGHRISGGEKTRIRNGDRIRLAGIEFSVREL